MGGYWSYHKHRRVQCPNCGRDFWSQVYACQCSECKVRFDGDENLYKSYEDRAKERKEMDHKLAEIETIMVNTISTVKNIRKQLKPLK